MSNYNGLEIAIIGMSGRFPGAADVSTFWENLKAGVESIRTLSDEELLTEGEQKHVINMPDYVKAASFLEDKQYFDAGFFGFRPEEATLMDPQIRIFLETCYAALEEGGYSADRKEKIGLFAGGYANLNWENYSLMANEERLVDPYSASQLRQINYLCSRVSYLLNLQGPSVYLNTACSTSLVSVQRACMSLLLNECKMALAGGIRINNYSKKGYQYQEGMINSKDGHCRAFDADSSGTVGGEGTGVVLLKKLKDAIKDGDVIHAIIKGSAVNNDGADKMSFTAPSVDGQFKTIAKAMQMAKIVPESISYVETHGTGTSLGDPIEIEALKMAFGSSDNAYCALGAVKTNVGHLDAAAGITGLIKVVLALKYKQLPPTLHFTKPNPKLSFESSPFYVNTTLQEWKKNGLPRRAGVSSFGIGGTNAHVILEEAPESKNSEASPNAQLLTISGKTRTALESNVHQLGKFLEQHKGKIALADVAYTLQTTREAFAYRKTFSVNHKVLDYNKLSDFKLTDSSIVKAANKRPLTVFMFSGQGAQYGTMCLGLYETESFFKEVVDSCLTIVAKQSGKDLKPVLFADLDDAIHNTEYTQPSLFIVEYALARLLMHWGIQPDTMIGHSIGEYVAASISGLFSLEDALTLVLKRGELMQKAPKGDMLSVSITEASLRKLLENQSNVSLAVVNSTELCVVSGSAEAIAAFKVELDQKEISSKLVRTSHAFHSHMMEGILDEFKEVVSQAMISELRIPFISNLTGESVTLTQVANPQYWVDHLRHTVNFSSGIENLLGDSPTIFIEVGPGKSLSSFVKSNKCRNKTHKVVNMVRSQKEETHDQAYLLSTLGLLWESGLTPNWKALYENETRSKVSLPTYAFDKVEYPVIVDAYKMVSERMIDTGLTKNQDLSSWFYRPTWKISKLTPTIAATDTTTTLVFSDELNVADQLVQKLSEGERVTICVKAGEVYEEHSPAFYTINPTESTHYRQLFSRLSDHGYLPQRIIHGWNIGLNEESFSENGFQNACFSLLEILKANQKHSAIAGKQITVLSSGLYQLPGQASSGTAIQSMASAFLKVASQEFPGLITSYIDVSTTDIDIEALYDEVQDRQGGKVVALRGTWRFVQDFEAIKAKQDTQTLRKQGVYLITGGLGAFGINLAEYLLKEWEAKVVLIGRTELPVKEEWESLLHDSNSDQWVKEKIQSLQRLEELPGDVQYQACDIADLANVQTLTTSIKTEFGVIHGLFHAAGANRGAATAISALDKAAFDKQLAPKVLGLESLKAALEEEALDFCLITSSLSVVLGGLGFGAYAPANAYMDAYVRYWQSKGQLTNWLSVNFDGLDFDGNGPDSISPEEQIETIKELLALKNNSQVVVSVSDLSKRLAQWVQTSQRDEELLPESINEVAENSTESNLINLWQRFFGKADLEASDDFFEIGGDSLKALTMIGRIHKLFHVEVSIKDFFEQSTIAGLASHIDELLSQVDTNQQSFIAIPKAPEQEYYPLSSAQKRLFFLYEFDKASLAYNSTHLFTLEGKVDKERLSLAFQQLVQRHESLRTSFDIVGEAQVQRITDTVDFGIKQFQATEEEAQTLIKSFIRPFDLLKAPLIRAGLLEVASEKHILIVDLHHIITDGVSFGVLARDFMALYNHETLAELNLQYKDFATWQQSEEHQKETEKQRDFWHNEYAVEASLLQLPTDYPRPLRNSHKGGVVGGALSKEITTSLKSMADREKTTLYMVMLSAYNILLNKLSGQEDIVVGSDLAGRPHADLEKIIGMFIHTVPIRNYPKADLSFKDFLSAVKSKTLACFDNQSYQYEELVDELKIERNTSRNPLFDVMFAWQNFEGGDLELPGLALRHFPHELGIAKFDMSLTAEEHDGEIIFKVEYATDLFKKETVERFITYFQRIIQAITSNPKIRLGDIQLAQGEERVQLLQTFNDTRIELPKHQTFIPLFHQQVEKSPESTAVVHNGSSLTYQQLFNRVNHLAGYLKSIDIKPNAHVALYMPRGIDMLTSILAVFQAGGGYVPIDVNYPIDRTREILWSSEAEIVLTDKKSLVDIAELHPTIPTIREVARVDALSENTLPFTRADIAETEDLAYIIYTSGTTGKPKGVMIHQLGMVNHLYAKIADLNLQADDIIAQTASPCFDISVWQFLAALLVGGKTHIVDADKVLEPQTLIDELDGGKVTVFESVPSLITSFLDGLPSEHDTFFKSLRWMIPTGEALSVGLVTKWYGYFPEIPLVNAYGPTEASDDVTHYIVPTSTENELFIPIGKPIQNTHIYVLDKALNLCPVGVRGEIHVAGLGVGKGYWKDKEKTAKAFVNNPFAQESGNPDYTKLYKTGDIGYVLEDGNIACLGRVDEQVKIRGNRIELGEIEYQINNYPEVQEGVVLAKEKEGDKYLVTYYEADREISQQLLRAYLAESLPEYMVPSYYVYMEAFPLTANGKLNKRALPDPEFSKLQSYVAPANEVEELLTGIWSDILKIHKDIISTDSSFFELGGHSLRAMVLVNKILKELQVEVPLKEVFERRDIQSIGSYILTAEKSVFASIEKAEAKAYYPTSSAQKRQYFLWAIDPDALAYNSAQMVILEGELDKEKVERTFSQLIARHESLRTSIKLENDQPVQRIAKRVPFSVEQSSGTEADVAGIVKAFIKPFDLNLAPLMRVGLIQLSAREHLLMVDMHHIITDGVSQEVLIREFSTLYQGEMLTPIKSHYKDYAQWQQSEAQQLKIKKQKQFWRNQFSEEIEALDLPTEGPRPAILTNQGNILKFKLEKGQTKQLRTLATQYETTTFMLILAIYNVFLSKLSSQEDIVIGTPTAGRPGIDFEKVIGMFVNILPLRNRPKSDLNFNDFLSQLKSNTLECFDNQDYQYEELVEELNVERNSSRNPLFDAMFLFHNIDDSGLEIPELSVKPYKNDHYTSNFDITLIAVDQQDEISLNFEYSTDLFAPDTMQRFLAYFKSVVQVVLVNPTTRLADIELITDPERVQVLDDFNQTELVLDGNQTIHGVFEKGLINRSEATALTFEGTSFSYHQLNERSNQLARKVLSLTKGSEQTIGIMVPRSESLIISILAVLKSGCAYVPIDPDYPIERVKYIAENSGFKTLLSESSLQTVCDLLPDDIQVVDVKSADVSSEKKTNPDVPVRADGLAYVIYTSGSTGNPKGVMVEHRNFINLVEGVTDRIDFTNQKTMLCLTTASFDMFGVEAILPLLKGLQIVLASKADQRDTKALGQLMMKGQVDSMQITPSHLKLLLDSHLGVSALSNITLLLVGGEAFPQELLSQLKAQYDGLIYNMYGPTETTVWSSIQELTYAEKIDIGKPIANTVMRILDQNHKLLPIGIAGELWIGGAGVARGYFENEALTGERFITDPITGEGRIYRTGDLTKWLPDGSLSYLSRIDNQVKVRGFRIELGEIEYQLNDLEEINETAVVVREKEGDKLLVAFYLANDTLDAEVLKKHLSQKIPEYMVPSFFIQLDEMPLSTNGKLDRKALPELHIVAEENYVAPRNEVEEKLVLIWQDVLKLDKEAISIKSNFFNLGGHSLRSIALVNKAFKEFEVEIPIKLIFELKDIESLAGYIQQAEKSDYLVIERSEEQKDFYALASAQKAIYFFYEFDRESLAYNMPQVLRIEGLLDREHLNSIFKQLLDRHEILRTSFSMINDEPVQVVSDRVSFEMGFERLKEDQVRTRFEELIRPFNLEEAPLFRVNLIEINAEVHYLVVDTHHIVMDGISNAILAGEFIKLYNQESLPELKLQYKDYAEWQQSEARLEKLETQKEFWVDEFSEGITRLQLPKDYTNTSEASNSGGSTNFQIGAEDTAKLKVIIEKEGASMFMFILAVYNILLAKLASQEDIIVGTPVAGREHFDMESMLGMFVAALPLRNYPKSDQNFKEFLKELVDRTLAYFENQAYQYEAPIHELNVDRSTSQNALYNAFFIFQNFERAEGTGIENLQFTAYDTGDSGDSWYDITLIAGEQDEVLNLNLGCNKLFKHETRERFVSYFKQIVRSVIDNLEIPLAAIDITTEAEKTQILQQFNSTKQSIDKQKTFTQYFNEQVAKTPEDTAVEFNGASLTYQQLQDSAIEISSCLRAKGVKANSKVALYMPRSIDMLTSILAIFHAGAAYVPIDVDYPAERVKNILNDSEASWVLFNGDSAQVVEETAEAMPHIETFLNVQELDAETYKLNKEPGTQTTDDLAYIIYTSGTTGKPKGAMIHQLGMVNHLQAKIRDLALDSRDIIAQTASPCFDISVWQFLAGLLVGGKTTIIDTEKLVDPEKLIAALQGNEVTIFESVPSLITAFLDGLPSHKQIALPDLRWMIPTGEALTVPLVRKWYHHFPEIKLLNAYGPTEASDDVTHHIVETPQRGQVIVPIGKPVQNTHIYVMDQHLNLCPVGVRGEICVAGLGVGKGYWKDEEKTKAVFHENPLTDRIGDPDYARLYKTGDIGYYLEDGTLICLGRVDEQVKIRGFRIELGEIENVLLEKYDISEAVVIVKEQEGDKHLVAYFMADKELAVADLRDYLFEKLPDYMVPSYFMQLTEFPLTTNGKLNKAALPEPEFGAEAEYIAPEGEIEEKLVAIWSEVLDSDKDKISVVESFFFMGGHSLNSITLTSKIHKEFNVKISLKEFFAKPTVRLLASHIDAHLWLIEKPRQDNVKKKEFII